MTIQRQTEDLWCWAAVSASIEDYFSPGRGAPTSQCTIASALFDLDCCARSGDCDEAHLLQEALKKVGLPPDGRLAAINDGTVGFLTIEEEILKKRPVCARIAWKGGGAHYVIIIGYSVSPDGTRHLIVQDPLFFPMNPVPYDEFRDEYLGKGRWTATFLVKE